MSPSKIKTIAFVSLGCPKNLVDSERMLGLLAEDGLALVGQTDQADAIIINTCGFLEAARQESLAAIREAVAHKAGRCQRVIVAGCLAQRDKTRLLDEVPQIDRLVGVFDRSSILAAVRGKANPRLSHGQYLGKYQAPAVKSGAKNKPAFDDDRGRFRLTPRHWAYLRISEGCNQGCAFCTIPSIRGPMRSKPLGQIIDEANELSADGAVELNLIGQDTTSYGRDIGYEPGLAGLLREMDQRLTGIPWLRLMYAYPSCFTDDMIRAIGDSARVVKYIDIPLQHINDRVLQRMRRRVTKKQTLTLLEKLRQWIPGIAIRTTFISGTPGETRQQHQELLRFVRDFGFDMMGVFAYSPERGTAMAKMDGQISEQVKKRRVEELMLAQQEVAFARAREMIGRTHTVLVDQPAPGRKGYWESRGSNQAPEIDSLTLVKAANLFPGHMLQVTITGTEGYDLLAKPAKVKSHSLKVL